MKIYKEQQAIISYLGFAIKAKKVVIGQSHIKRYQGELNLILVCNTATDNLKNLGLNLANKHNCDVIITNELLSNLTHLDNIKILGITDKNLSDAIIKNKEIISIG